MTDLQFERFCNVLTGLLVLLVLGSGVLSFMALRARSVWLYQQRVRQNQFAIDTAKEEYRFTAGVAIALGSVTLLTLGFRVWAYVVRGV